MLLLIKMKVKKQNSNPLEIQPETKWWVFNLQTILNKLYSSESGLSENEVEKRRLKFGLNILPRKKQEGLLDILWNQIKSSMVIVLVIAVLISFILSCIA